MISPTAFATLLDDLIRDADLKGVVETATTADWCRSIGLKRATQHNLLCNLA